MNWFEIVVFYFKHTKGYRCYLVAFFLCTFFMGFESSFFNYAISYIIGKVSTGVWNYNLTFLLHVLIFAMGVFFFEMLYVADRYVTSKSIPYINRNILVTIYKQIQSMQYVFFKKKTTGEISNRISLLHDNFDDLIFDLGHNTPKEILRIIVSLLTLISINTFLGCIITVWTLIFIFVLYKISIKITECTYKEYNCGHDIAGKITDRLLNIQTIFSFFTMDKEAKRLHNEYNAEYITAELNTYKYKILLFLCGGSLYFGIIIYFFFAIIHLKNNGIISITTAAFALQQFLVVGRTLWYVNTYLQDVLHEFSALRSVMDLFYNKEYYTEEKEVLPSLKPAQAFKIEFRNVSFNYDNNEKDVLKDFNLIINPGEKIGIVGESGVGKTSILSLLLKLFQCSSGKILINDFDINLISTKTLREQISVIPQDTILFNRTIMENIKYGAVGVSDSQIYDVCKKIKIHDSILQFPQGYNTLAGERGINLSGGQRQKISIARALIKKSSILLLDEITSALDTMSEASVLETINLFDQTNPTTICIAHKLSTLKNMDRIIVIDKGRIVEEGGHNDLIKNNNSYYHKLWEEQKKGYF